MSMGRKSTEDALASWRPRLRPEVALVGGAEGGFALRQPRTGQLVRVGPVTRAVVGALDGTRTLEDVLDHALRAGVTRADAEDSLRALLLLAFVEGAGDEQVGALLAVDERSPPLALLPGSRFTCHGSGQCCRTYSPGPIEKEDVRRIEALDLRAAFPELGDGPYFAEDDQGRPYLAKKGERCVFLLDDARCGIHARFGVEAKPNLCRMYPWRTQLTIAGLRVVDTSECATFATSVRSGEPLEAQLDRLRALFPERHEVHHPLVLLDREHPSDYGWIVALEKHLVAALGASRLSPARALHAVSERAFGFADALARCPLAPGEPDATVAALLARPVDAGGPPPLTESGLDALRAVLGALRATIAERALDQPVVPFFERVLRAAEALPGEPGPPLADPEHAGAVVRASMASSIFAGRLLAEGRLRAGLVRLALVPLLAVAGARLFARERGMERATDDGLSEGHRVANVALRMLPLVATLIGHEHRAPEIAGAAAALLSGL